MKKLIYTLAVVLGLSSIFSAIAAGYYLWNGIYGPGLLAMIFVYIEIIATTITIALAQDYPQ